MGSERVPRDDERLAIGDAARIAGVAVETLRRWANDGRVASERTPGGQRRFRRADIERLNRQSESEADDDEPAGAAPAGLARSA